jgi:predicted 3-demethylubiquinone-9 3-methyltransferase (glyoxalase superfamily)
MTMQAITPFLWFDDQAEAAVAFYRSVFQDSSTGDVTRYDAPSAEVSGRPQNSVMTVAFQLKGFDFVALNGGPIFKFSPAISFVANFEAEAELDVAWEALSQGGMVCMPLAAYPFSEKFGWVQDQYGISWQLNWANRVQKIAPCLMFTGEQHGKAEEAIRFYTSLFQDSEVLKLDRYEEGEDEVPGTIKHALFSLKGQKFSVIESSKGHPFTFTEAISLMVTCETQADVDRLWDALTEGGDKQAQQCGWLKDKYGVSWQIVPNGLRDLLSDPDPAKAENATKTLLTMKKLDLNILKQAACS